MSFPTRQSIPSRPTTISTLSRTGTQGLSRTALRSNTCVVVTGRLRTWSPRWETSQGGREHMVRVEILQHWLSLLLRQRWKMHSNGWAVWQHYGSICFSSRAHTLNTNLTSPSVALTHLLTICHVAPNSGFAARALTPSPLHRSAKRCIQRQQPAHNANKTINPGLAPHPRHMPIETAVKTSCYAPTAQKPAMVTPPSLHQH